MPVSRVIFEYFLVGLVLVLLIAVAFCLAIADGVTQVEYGLRRAWRVLGRQKGRR